ncbi:MAG: Mu-like prophage major head subunit gpT family protein [Desulfarculus sp.]|nr:Mu-like prophage major head subunit gpT family protein [Desulfarculus sp.]
MIVNGESLAALSKSFETMFLEAYANTPSGHERIATVVPSGQVRTMEYGWLGNFPAMREWIGDRVINALAAHKYSIINKSFEATVEVDRDDVADDIYGVYAPMFQQLGMGAKQHPTKLVFNLLKGGFTGQCYDGQYFFDSDHPVGETTVSNTGGGSGTAWYLLCTTYPLKPFIFQDRKKPELVAQDRPTDEAAFRSKMFRYGVDYRGNAGYGLWQLAYGSKQTLDATYYAAARAAVMSYKKENGDPLGLVPDLVVVPPTLESAGRSLLTKEKDAAGADNPWFKTAELLVSPWLA